MTESLEKPPEEGTPLKRLRSDARAESRWRRHEIMGRLAALRTGQEKLEKEINRVLEFLETIGLPKHPLPKKKKVVDAKELPMGELTEHKDKEKPDG